MVFIFKDHVCDSLKPKRVFREEQFVHDILVQLLRIVIVLLAQKMHILLQILHHVPLTQQVCCFWQNALDCSCHAWIKIRKQHFGRVVFKSKQMGK